MSFSDQQTHQLKSKLRMAHVRLRSTESGDVAYIEGWHAVAEANRIFGFDSWDRQTISPTCHWTELHHGKTVCFYSTKVRITVRAGGTITIREGIGTGLGRADLAEVAHDIAIKSAETDATKRALATFGNPFGLALYDRHRQHVTKSRTQAHGQREVKKSETGGIEDSTAQRAVKSQEQGAVALASRSAGNSEAIESDFTTSTARARPAAGHRVTGRADAGGNVFRRVEDGIIDTRNTGSVGNRFAVGDRARTVNASDKKSTDVNEIDLGARKVSKAKDGEVRRPEASALILKSIDQKGQQLEFRFVQDFLKGVECAVSELATLDDVYTFWSQNLAAFSRACRENSERSDLPHRLSACLKKRAREITTRISHGEKQLQLTSATGPTSSSSFLLPKEKRLRDKEHLAFVASQPCLVCGRRPSVAHHLKFAQNAAMAMKVSDEFAVPLCNTHHDQLHRSSDERAWWARNGVLDPVKTADRLWAASRGHRPKSTIK